MIETIKNYLLGILLVMTVGTTYLSYSLQGRNAVLNSEVDTLVAEVKEARADTKMMETSCLISQNISTDVTEANRALQESLTDIMTEVGNLTTTTIQEKINEPKTGPTGAYTPDTARLSPNLMQLLDRAYCSSAKSDPSCTIR